MTDGRVRVVRLGPAGEVKDEWRGTGRGQDPLRNPVGLAVDARGDIYVADYDRDEILRFTPEGRFVSAFGESGAGDGQLNSPSGLAIGASGDVHVADFYNHRVHRFGPNGEPRSAVGRPGRIGPGALHYPTGVAAEGAGGVVVADAYNYRLQWFGASGECVRQAGRHVLWLWPRRGDGTSGLNVPTSVAVGRDGRLHVADSGNHRVVMLSSEGAFITTWTIPDATADAYSPQHVAVSPDGTTVYATDLLGGRVIVLRAPPS